MYTFGIGVSNSNIKYIIEKVVIQYIQFKDQKT